MDELVKIDKSPVTGNPIINARDLHKSLGIGKDFSSWIKPILEKWEFIEDEEFTILYYDKNNHRIPTPPKGGMVESPFANHVYRIDYILTFDCAKEIVMLQNNKMGKKIRRYFIEVEKEWKKIKSEEPKTIMLEARNMSVGEVAKSLGTCSHRINQVLRKNRYVRANNLPYDKYLTLGYFAYERYNPEHSAKRLMVTSTKGMPLVQELLGKTSYLPEVVRQAMPVIQEQQQQSLLPAVVGEWITRVSEQEVAFNAMINHMMMCKAGKNNHIEEEKYMTALQTYHAKYNQRNPQ